MAMGLLTSFIIAVGLSMDCCAAALGRSLEGKMDQKGAFFLAGSFAIAQAVMPLIGYLLGLGLRDIVKAWDHWIAFTILALIGLRMLLGKDKDDNQSILLLAVATSIDALVIGLGFAFIGAQIFQSSAIIGIVTFVLTLGTIYLGTRVAASAGKIAKFAGGIILIGIGFSILIQHLMAG